MREWSEGELTLAKIFQKRKEKFVIERIQGRFNMRGNFSFHLQLCVLFSRCIYRLPSSSPVVPQFWAFITLRYFSCFNRLIKTLGYSAIITFGSVTCADQGSVSCPAFATSSRSEVCQALMSYPLVAPPPARTKPDTLALQHMTENRASRPRMNA